MILVTGGFCQGKREFAAGLMGLTVGPGFDAITADGQGDDPALAFERDVLIGFHHYIAVLLSRGQSAEPFVRQVIAHRPAVIVMDEVGYGIVPIDKNDRSYREAVGRAGQLLAAEADEVYRVVCGIGTRIKG